MNYQLVLIVALSIVLLISIYLVIEKDKELSQSYSKISDLEAKLNYMQSRNEQLIKELEIINSKLPQYEQTRYYLTSRINELENKLIELNISLEEKNKMYEQLLDQYIQLNKSLAEFDNNKILIEEIRKMLDWVGTNYKGTSSIYEKLKNEIVQYCLNNSILDLSCSYYVIENYITYDNSMNAVTIFNALEMKKGDCLTYSILMHRLITDLRPIKVKYIVRNIGIDHKFIIRDQYYNIKDHSSETIDYKISKVVCYGNRGAGHCGLVFDDLLIDYKYGRYLGKIGDNIDYCKTESCKWKTGYITMIIDSNDIEYLDRSLRRLLG